MDDSEEALEGLSNMFVERDMSREELVDYRKQVTRSGGFDVEAYPKSTILCGGIRPIIFVREERRKDLSNYSKAALQEYNANNKNANYEFMGVVKANHQSVAGKMYYITFEAKDISAASDQIPVIFQASVWEKLFKEGIEVMDCEIKPTL